MKLQGPAMRLTIFVGRAISGITARCTPRWCTGTRRVWPEPVSCAGSRDSVRPRECIRRVC